MRHLGYQNGLRLTSANATPDAPTHALGMAFDIAIVNTPLETVQEISDVLAADERRRRHPRDRRTPPVRLSGRPTTLPSRLVTEVYAHLIAGQPWMRPADASASVTPVVDVATSSLQPMPAYAAEWWAADNLPLDMPISVRVESDHPAGGAIGGRGLAGYFGLVGELLSSTWRFMSPWSV